MIDATFIGLSPQSGHNPPDWRHFELAAVQYGIIKGKEDGYFAPNDRITRVQAAAMIGRAMKLDFVKDHLAEMDQSRHLTDFTDASFIADWAKDDVELVYQARILDGTAQNQFNPNGYTTRDQMAKILSKFLDTAKLK